MKLDHSQKRRIIEIAVIVVLSCVLFLACNHNSLNNDIVISNRDDSANEADSSKEDAPAANLPDLSAETAKDEEAENTAKEKNPLQKKVCVYVCGGVVNPGLYEFPEGSRRMEAVEAAGGFSEDACRDYINLAEYLTDGEMLRIPLKEEITSYPLEGGNEGSAAGRVNINKATAEQLTAIPGIGKSKADAIIRFRTSGGKFETPEDLMKIPGIKQGTYEKLKDFICVN